MNNFFYKNVKFINENIDEIPRPYIYQSDSHSGMSEFYQCLFTSHSNKIELA